jgi:hypothetical protein
MNETRRGVLAAIGTGFAMSATAGMAGANEEAEDAEEVEAGEDAARVVHLSPDAPALDVYVDGELWFEGVEPLSVRDHFTPSEPGTYDVAAVPTGEDPEDAIYETECVVEGGPCTLAIIGELCDVSDAPFDLVALHEDHGETEADHARVKAVHASPDAETVDVAIEDGETVGEGLAFGESVTSEVRAGEGVLTVRGSEGGMSERFEIDLEPGHVYTVFAIGYLEPESAPEDAPDDLSFMLAITQSAEPGER